MNLYQAVQNLQSSFDTFVSQIQFNISTFLSVCALFATILVVAGAFLVNNIAKKAAQKGVEAIQKELDLHNKMVARIDALELAQIERIGKIEADFKSLRAYISKLGVQLHSVAFGDGHDHPDEQIYFGQMESILYVAGTFYANSRQEAFALLPCGYRPGKEIRVIAVPSNQSGDYGLVQIMSDGRLMSNVPLDNCYYTIQAFIEPPV